MANNIEIIIEDKVDSSISTKLKAIASDAKQAHSYISLLKGELSKLGSFSVSGLQTQMRNVSSELDKIRAKLKAGDYKAVINIETRQSNLKQGDYVAQINAENRVLQGQQKILAGNAAEENRNAQAKERLLNKAYPLRQAYMAYNAAIAESNRLLQQGVISTQAHAAAQEHALATLQRSKLAQAQWNESLLKTNKTSELSRMHMVNLGYQLNDIGVSLASGQNPMVVFIQQGSQIAGIAAAAGVSMGQMAKSAAALIAPFLPLAAAVGTVVGAFALFRSELEKQSPAKEYLKTLGLTTKEMKQVKDQTVTMGDAFRGLFKTLEDRFGTTTIFKTFINEGKNLFEGFLYFIKSIFIGIIALGTSTYKLIIDIWKNFPNHFGDFFIRAANLAIRSLNSITDASTDLVNFFIEKLNRLPKGLIGIEIIPEFDKKRMDLLANPYAEAGKNYGEDFFNNFFADFDKYEKKVDKFIDDIGENTLEERNKRLKKQADEILEGKTSSADKAAEKRATTLAKINAELDNELNRMFMLKPQREIQAKYDSIMEKMIGKRITLSNEEKKAIWDKIAAIREATLAQSKYDQLYDEVYGPLENYNALIMASDELFKRRIISQEKFEAIFANAAEQYRSASDSMYDYNKNLKEQLYLESLPTNKKGVESDIFQLQRDQLSKNTVLPDTEIEKYREMLYLRQELASIEGDPMNLNAQLDQYKSFYQTLEEMRSSDFISEKAYSNAKAKLVKNENQIKLDAASGFFGELSGLQQSNVKELARIGKAAAIAQATINVAEGATKALAQGGIFGAAMMGAVIAAGAAQIATIASQRVGGYKQGGWTGSGPVDRVAGVVHSQEFVFDAKATRRLGVGNLEALRAGAAQLSSNSSVGKQGAVRIGSGFSVNIENYGTSKEFEVQQIGESDVRIIARDEARQIIRKETPTIVAGEIRNPNSSVSKSLTQSTQIQRRR